MEAGQSPLAAPSVFNFFLPDYQPKGEIANQGFVAPEFQIHNTKLSVGYINHTNAWLVWNALMTDWETGNPQVSINVDKYKKYASDPEVLLNELDMKSKGHEAKIILEGASVSLIPELVKPGNPLNGLWKKNLEAGLVPRLY